MKHLFLSLIFLSFISTNLMAQEDELIDGIVGVVGSKVILYVAIKRNISIFIDY